MSDQAVAPGSPAETGISVQRVAGHVGAEVTGVELSGSLSPATVELLQASVIRYGVLFFRDQADVDERRQVEFAQLFGPVTLAHPTLSSLESNPNVLDLDYSNGGRANWWHSDATFLDRPPAMSVLRAVVVPPYGGDTVWASAVAAYRQLPADLRTRVDPLRVIHSNGSYDERPREGVATEMASSHSARFRSIPFVTEHPVVRVHPVSGDRALMLGGFAHSIVGLSAAESEDLMGTLQGYVTQLENTVRWRWRPGDLAMSDNCVTQHRVIDDWGDQKRRLNRVTLVGSMPVGADGRASVPIEGDSSTFNVGDAGR